MSLRFPQAPCEARCVVSGLGRPRGPGASRGCRHHGRTRARDGPRAMKRWGVRWPLLDPPQTPTQSESETEREGGFLWTVFGWMFGRASCDFDRQRGGHCHNSGAVCHKSECGDSVQGEWFVSIQPTILSSFLAPLLLCSAAVAW